MNRTVIEGQLEIDHDRGVIYFNSNQGCCILRICNLPKPIPQIGADPIPDRTLDITHLIGQDWDGIGGLTPGSPGTYRLDYPMLVRPSNDRDCRCTVMGEKKDADQD